MTDLAAWPDIHDVLIADFADLSAKVVGPKKPSNMQELVDAVPDATVILVRRVGGFDDMITDTPRVDVEVYARTYATARDTALAVQQRLLNFPRPTPAGSIDSTRTEVGPREIPNDDQTIRCVAATYRLDTRR